MGNEEKIKRLREKKKRLNKQNINMSYVVIAIIVFVLILFDYLILDALDGFSMADFIKDTIGNLMGVLAAFLIFDIIHDKMSKDSYAEEVSEQILQTLFEQEGIDALDDEVKRKFITASLTSIDTDKEAAAEIADQLDRYLQDSGDRAVVLDRIAMFTEAQKYQFIENNVHAIVPDPDAASMVQNFLRNYLVGALECRIRTSFEYNFVLRRLPEGNFQKLKHRDEYFLVEETLTYHVKYLTESMNNTGSHTVSIGFAYDNKSLDKFLRDSQVNQAGAPLNNCIFRESLDIDPEDMQYFSSLSPQELRECFQEMFKPHLTIDGRAGEIIGVKAYDYGVVVEFTVDHDTAGMEHVIDMAFAMPKKWNGQLEVAIVDPTHNPRIALNYDGETMQVEMFSFLDKGDDSSYANTHTEDIGIYRIVLNDTWVYPVSGVLFTIDKK